MGVLLLLFLASMVATASAVSVQPSANPRFLGLRAEGDKDGNCGLKKTCDACIGATNQKGKDCSWCTNKSGETICTSHPQDGFLAPVFSQRGRCPSEEGWTVVENFPGACAAAAAEKEAEEQRLAKIAAEAARREAERAWYIPERGGVPMWTPGSSGDMGKVVAILLDYDGCGVCSCIPPHCTHTTLSCRIRSGMRGASSLTPTWLRRVLCMGLLQAIGSQQSADRKRAW